MADLPSALFWEPALGQLGAYVTDLDEVHQALCILLLTPTGYDPLRPEFGVGIQKWVDRPIQRIIGRASSEIMRAIARWEPRAEPLELNLFQTGDAGLRIKVRWRPARTPVSPGSTALSSLAVGVQADSAPSSAGLFPWIPFTQSLQISGIDGGLA